LVDINEILRGAVHSASKSVVVTGGEPLSYPMGPLCQLFIKAGFEIFLETSGAYPISGTWNWICLSPKKNRKPLPEIFSKAHELKVIIQTPADFSWAEENALKVNKYCRLYLQPEWSQYEKVLPKIIEYIKAHQEWRISLQAHKFMHIP